jgi:hypothetical protein
VSSDCTDMKVPSRGLVHVILNITESESDLLSIRNCVVMAPSWSSPLTESTARARRGVD